MFTLHLYLAYTCLSDKRKQQTVLGIYGVWLIDRVYWFLQVDLEWPKSFVKNVEIYGSINILLNYI